jgi:undecaprenyl-diphosphatase
MTTFEGIIYALIHGISEFIPVGAHGHEILAGKLLGLGTPGSVGVGGLALGAAIALLIVFRHDWASMISSFLQVLIFRKYPMTLDERMPFFLLLSCVPAAAGMRALESQTSLLVSNPTGAALAIAAGALFLWIGESLSRRTKNIYDLNIVDAVLVGVSQLGVLVPGLGPLTATLALLLLRNYRLEAAAKYAFFAALPMTIVTAVQNLQSIELSAPQADAATSWITLSATVVVTAVFGTLTLGGFMRQIQRKGLGGYVAYRLVAGLALAAWLQLGFSS